MADATKRDEAAGWAAFAIAVMVPFALREKGILDNNDIRKMLSGAAGYADSDDFAPSLDADMRKRVSTLLQEVMRRVPG